jgi:hypothetical protein
MSDYYQGIVEDYLRADRATFVKPECLIQIEPGRRPPKGSSWYCDALAVNFRSEPAAIYLCEVTYSETPHALIKKLKAWNGNWSKIGKALVDDCHLPIGNRDKQVRPWLFVPEDKDGKQCAKKLVEALKEIQNSIGLKFTPLITTLEMVQPWKYPDDRKSERVELKPDFIPEEWRK